MPVLVFKYPIGTKVLISEVKLANVLNTSTFETVKAIWDTGATNTNITKKLATKLGLVSIGKVTVSTASHNGELRNVYLTHIQITSGDLSISINAYVTECEDVLGNCDVLVGMDIIGLGDFAISHNPIETLMSFRVPSDGRGMILPDSNTVGIK